MITTCTISGMPAPVARLAVAVFCGYAAIGAGIQILPEAARERFGASEWAIGAAVTAASLAAVVARPVAGRRADERGRAASSSLAGCWRASARSASSSPPRWRGSSPPAC